MLSRVCLALLALQIAPYPSFAASAFDGAGPLSMPPVVASLPAVSFTLDTSTAPPGPTSGLYNVVDQSPSLQTDPGFGTQPNSASGRLYVVDPNDNTKHYCTAQFVNYADKPSKSVLLTAAHCVFKPYNASRPADNRQYVLDHFTRADNGHDIGDQYSIKCNVYPTEWANRNTDDEPFIRVRYDYALVRTTTDLSAGNPLTVDFGVQVRSQIKTHLLGFPDAVNGGLYHNATLSVLSQMKAFDVIHQKLFALPTLKTLFTQGVSGGGWITDSGNIFTVTSSFAMSTLPSAANYNTLYGANLAKKFFSDGFDALSKCP